ncbi:hypothetical protein QR680_002120 [Steinernema hermaphroditum]|uniref:Uncharacterized protein n=1 Tax=Steinernema hermaphroditum TaxID=289476 RepID=A0AA39H264_9BILA|nr:hypothetical protein QR680_002120 [Steinernema hermaphroditum]
MDKSSASKKLCTGQEKQRTYLRTKITSTTTTVTSQFTSDITQMFRCIRDKNSREDPPKCVQLHVSKTPDATTKCRPAKRKPREAGVMSNAEGKMEKRLAPTTTHSLFRGRVLSDSMFTSGEDPDAKRVAIFDKILSKLEYKF